MSLTSFNKIKGLRSFEIMQRHKSDFAMKIIIINPLFYRSSHCEQWFAGSYRGSFTTGVRLFETFFTRCYYEEFHISIYKHLNEEGYYNNNKKFKEFILIKKFETIPCAKHTKNSQICILHTTDKTILKALSWLLLYIGTFQIQV